MQEEISRRRARRSTYQQSHLSGVDLRELEERLHRLMDTERLYTRDDLSLPAFAELLGTTPHRLSEYLNTVQRVSFSDYINRRRIDAARELLLSRPNDTVLAIAYDVCFNSKSAFNTAFARFTGASPTAFRKQGQPSKS